MMTVLAGLLCAPATAISAPIVKPGPAARPTPPPARPSPQLGLGMPLFDRIVTGALNTHNIPGGALAIVKNGRLVLARGYGLANVKSQEPVALDTLFSTASVTKTITAVAVLRLVDQGKLSLEDSVYALLDKPRPLGRAAMDSQVEKITVRQLLLHAAGWNAKIQGDFLHQTQKIARLTHEKYPLSAEVVTRYGLSRPLDFAPGSDSHYSNYGYFLAKQIVQRAARQPYETYVRQDVLQPLGITNMRVEQLAPAYSAGESRRYRNDGQEFPGGREPIAAPAGSWLANVVDLARFVSAVSGDRDPPLLSAAARQQMFAVPPSPLATRKSGSHVGLGWDVVREGPAGLEFHKSGSMAGVRAYVEHCGQNVDWVLLLNSDGTPDERGTAVARLVPQIRQAIDSTQEWPDRDLFQSNSAVAREPRSSGTANQ